METLTLSALESLFHPKSIAVVGASLNMQNLGTRNLKQLVDFGFEGDLFAVNPRAEPPFGISAYQRLTDIPQPVDFCVIVVPARAVDAVVADCVTKNIPVAQILTGGFGEFSDEGRCLEEKLIQTAAGQTRLVGPNCMGTYSSAGKLTMVASASREVGTVSIASQSGGLSIDMILHAKARGLAFNKVISMGNCIDLDAVDFLNYFGSDPSTEVIGFYLEGLRRSKAFFDALKTVSKQKPVVILKGGRTQLGAASVASHTNALAGEYVIWQAAIAQAGGLMVESVDELLATLTALQPQVPRPRGRGVALVGNGGGTTVLATDELEEGGVTLAPLRASSCAALSEITMPPGATVGNATDTPIGALNTGGGEALGQVIRCLLDDPEVNGLIVHFNLGAFINYENRYDIADGVSAALASVANSDKPIYVALRATPDPDIEAVRSRILMTTQQLALPCFQSAQEAVRTFAVVCNWMQKKRFK